MYVFAKYGILYLAIGKSDLIHKNSLFRPILNLILNVSMSQLKFACQ